MSDADSTCAYSLAHHPSRMSAAEVKQGRATAAAAMTTAAVGGGKGVGVVGDGGSLLCHLAMLIFSPSGHRVGFTFVACAGAPEM